MIFLEGLRCTNIHFQLLVLFLSIHIDLTELTREVSHNIWRPVEDGLGFLNVIVTISGTDKTEKSQNNFLLGDAVKNQLLDKYVSNQVVISNKRILVFIETI